MVNKATCFHNYLRDRPKNTQIPVLSFDVLYVQIFIYNNRYTNEYLNKEIAVYLKYAKLT